MTAVAVETPTSKAHLSASLHPALSLALLAAPLIKIAAVAFAPALKSSAAAQLAVVSAHPHRWYAYTLLMVIGSVVMVPAAAALLLLARAGMRRVGTVGGILVTLGIVGSIVDCANQLWAWQMVQANSKPAQMAALLDRFNNDAATNLPFAITGIGLLIGAALLTPALIRNPSVPTWSALAFAAAVVINIAAFSNNSVAGVALSFLLLAAGMGAIGFTSLQHRASGGITHRAQPLPA